MQQRRTFEMQGIEKMRPSATPYGWPFVKTPLENVSPFRVGIASDLQACTTPTSSVHEHS